MQKASQPKKRAINVSVDPELAAEAKAAGLNLSGVLEAALRAELKAHRETKWREENKAAIEEINRYFEKHGSPLDKYQVW